jgi:hypothetical protein
MTLSDRPNLVQRRAALSEGRRVSGCQGSLCRGHHREAHRCGDQAAWWKGAGVDPTITAHALWLETHPLLTIPAAATPFSKTARGPSAKGARIAKRTQLSRFTLPTQCPRHCWIGSHAPAVASGDTRPDHSLARRHRDNELSTRSRACVAALKVASRRTLARPRTQDALVTDDGHIAPAACRHTR